MLICHVIVQGHVIDETLCELMTASPKFAQRFPYGGQHDAHEMTDFLLNALHEDTNIAAGQQHIKVGSQKPSGFLPQKPLTYCLG